MVRSDCPSVCGWWAIPSAALDPISFKKDSHSAAVN